MISKYAFLGRFKILKTAIQALRKQIYRSYFLSNNQFGRKYIKKYICILYSLYMFYDLMRKELL
ncbi:hypothetical protein A7A69_12630 [Acinetobacter sp. Ac_1271]|nr:hypothetical protein [Acinetobacter guerrae]